MAAQHEPGSPPSPRRVLVVDDEPPVGRALARELRGEFEVLVAQSAEEALGILEIAGDVCSVVSDLRMSGYGGLGLLAEVRLRRPGCARVLTSGSFDALEVADVLQSGIAQQFVPKPWRLGEVLAAVRLALSTAEPGGPLPSRRGS